MRGGCRMVANAVHLALAGFGIIAAMMLALWIIHLLLLNAAIVDVGWAAGLATLAVFYAVLGPGYSARKWAMAAMAGFWGFRLAVYLLFSRVLGKPEEGRYIQLRREWKTHLPRRSAGWRRSALRFGWSAFAERRWRITSSIDSGKIPRTAARPIAEVCGAIRGIPIISLSG